MRLSPAGIGGLDDRDPRAALCNRATRRRYPPVARPDRRDAGDLWEAGERSERRCSRRARSPGRTMRNHPQRATQSRQAPILRFIPEVDGAEVRIDAALPDTQRGRDAATMVRNGILRGLSIEFKSTIRGARRWRPGDPPGAVAGCGAGGFDGSYKGSLELRHKGGGARPGVATLWL